MAIAKVDEHSFLARGLFPRELPRCFSTVAFADASPGIPDPSPGPWASPTTLNLARPGSLRRRLSLPNPFSERLLIREIVKHWADIEAHYRRASLSISRPIADEARKRAVVWEHPWDHRPKERARRMHRGRYVLKSDVSEYYASVYTHSLEWALDGKASAKERIRMRGPSTLGAELDKLVRNGQDGQTKGLPIGPDSSLVLSEIVLTAVDVKLETALDDLPARAFRAVDDLEAFLSTQSEAEQLLVVWQTALSEYELMPNIRKTEILEGPGEIEPAWSRELRQMRLRQDQDIACANDLYSLFSRAFELAREWRYESVLSYVVQRAQAAIGRGPLSAAALQQLVMAAAVIDPSSMRYGSGIVERLIRAGTDIDKDRYADTLNDMCIYHAAREHGSEVTWALYELRRLGLQLNADAAALVAQMSDNCSLILLRDLEEHGHLESTPDFSSAVQRVEAEGVNDTGDWLLAFEYARRGWASDAHLKKEEGWRELLNADVGFYETPPRLKPAPPTKKDRAEPEPDVEEEPDEDEQWMPPVDGNGGGY